MEIIKVSAKSKPAYVAGSLAKIIRQKRASVSVNAIGAGAVNQSVKAIAVARRYLQEDGIAIACFPEFGTVAMDNGRECTSVNLVIQIVDKRLGAQA